ncbi:RNase HI [Anaerosporobacter mobilis DSM 15930]|jgi:ribonuclease HI|uniref:RNase HI n=1 Tax=Anaerosporobacter mobilis DSM 15930 TaxID=1120996 RepID=A0A1M7LIG2_9FIRM|nr:RNase H family protein [Anaerosporobacter mobilis]SHM77268.1 RNase HI [Anaerosporobacter mobilis DSM 15930]
MKSIDIYIDLDYKGRFDSGEGRYSIVLEMVVGDEPKTREHFGGFKETTNNRIALLACIDALKRVFEPCDITLHINSPYMARTNRQLKTWLQQSLDKRKNGDLLRKYADLIEQHEIEVVHEKINAYTGAMVIQRQQAKYELVMDFKAEDEIKENEDG